MARFRWQVKVTLLAGAVLLAVFVAAAVRMASHSGVDDGRVTVTQQADAAEKRAASIDELCTAIGRLPPPRGNGADAAISAFRHNVEACTSLEQARTK